VHNAKIILSLIILSHFISDFVLQSNELAKNKMINHHSLIKHGIVVFITSLGLTFHFFSHQLLIIISAITILHITIDLIKIKTEKRYSNFVSFFIIDQIFHLIAIISFYPKFKYIQVNPLGNYVNRLILESFPVFKSLSLTKEDWAILILIISAYIFVWTAGAILVKRVLDKFNFSGNDNEKTIGLISTKIESNRNNIGELIGQLERIVILTLILCKSLGAISLVFAAKSIARFNNFNKQDLADYYIVGTFASLLISLFIGLVLTMIISIYYSGNFILYEVL